MAKTLITVINVQPIWQAMVLRFRESTILVLLVALKK